jgi:phosphinothricin acetyltransferase
MAREDDAAALQSIYAPYCATPISFEHEAPTVAEMSRRMAKILPAYPWLVAEEGGAILGYAYAGPHRERAAYRWSVDVSVYIDRQQQRRGLGRSLYTLLFSLITCQGFVNAYAGITLPNPGSVGLHLAMGFTEVGIYRHVGYKCGAWHDVAWYQRLLQSGLAEPRPVKSLAEVLQMPEVREKLA